MNERLTELEIKVAYQEDTIQQLDRVICKQQDQIDLLTKQIKQLSHSAQQSEGGEKGLLSAIDEVPPHY
jgi:SlyX protein